MLLTQDPKNVNRGAMVEVGKMREAGPTTQISAGSAKHCQEAMAYNFLQSILPTHSLHKTAEGSVADAVYMLPNDTDRQIGIQIKTSKVKHRARGNKPYFNYRLGHKDYTGLIVICVPIDHRRHDHL